MKHLKTQEGPNICGRIGARQPMCAGSRRWNANSEGGSILHVVIATGTPAESPPILVTFW